MLTVEQQTKYLSNPIACPHCGSLQIESTLGLPSLKEVEAQVNCMDCKKTWNEVFILSKIYE